MEGKHKLELDALEEATNAYQRDRAEFAALSEDERRAPGVPKFWHSGAAMRDLLTPSTVLSLIEAARLVPELVGALEPFAKIAEHLTQGSYGPAWGFNGGVIEHEDFRRAAEVLAAISKAQALNGEEQ